MSELKITVPEMAEGQDSWGVYLGGGSVPRYAARRWNCRVIHRVLMYTHDRVETLWHWLFRMSERFAPTRTVEYVEPTLYGYVGKDGSIKSEVLHITLT